MNLGNTKGKNDKKKKTITKNKLKKQNPNKKLS